MFYILAISALLRLVFINQSLWLDESIEALALQGHFGPLLSYSLSDFQPPLYHFLLSGWTWLFGYSELALRTPSLISGVGVVYYVYKLGELIYSRRVAIIAGLIVATNPLLIYYSQEGRTYIITTLFVIMSFYYLLKRSSIPYLFSALFAIWSSYLACLIVPLQLIYLIKQKQHRIAIALVIVASSLLLWAPPFLRSLSIGMSDANVYPAWGQVVGGISWKALALTWVKTTIGRISFSPSWLYGSIVLAFSLFHGFIILRARKIHPLLFIWLATLLLAGGVSLFIPAYSYTRVLFVVPAYLLILALGLQRLPNHYTIVILGFQLFFLSYFWINPSFHKEDWRRLASDLPTSAVVAMPSRAQSAPLTYYGITQPIIEPAHDLIAGNPIYYIRYVEDLFDPTKLGQAKLKSSGYTINSQKTYAGIQVDIYENRD